MVLFLPLRALFHGLLQRLARLKRRHHSGGDGDLLAAAGVAARARRPELGLKAAKADDLYLLPGGEGLGDLLDGGVEAKLRWLRRC